VHVDNFDDFLRGIIDFLVTIIFVFLLLVVGSICNLGLVVALFAHHILEVLISALVVHQ